MDVIISVRSEYVQRIKAGDKTIEVRTKRPNLILGDVIWIYEKLPIGHITIRAKVEKVETTSQENAWRKYKSEMGITRDEYAAYLGSQEQVALIFMKTIRTLRTPISLDQLRKINSEFSPPQFMRKIIEPALKRRLKAAI